MEGVVDSSHLSILHTVGLKATDEADLDFAKKTNHMQFDAAPRLEAEETDFGFHYVALRRNDRGAEPVTEARIAPYVSPCFVLNRSEEHTSELQSLMRISYAVFCLKKKQTP